MRVLDSLLEFFNISGFILTCLIFVPLERVITLHKAQRVLRRWWWNDLIYVFVNRIFITAGLVLFMVGVGASASRLVPADLKSAVAGQPTWLQVVQIILVADVWFYTLHRLFHTVPWLWKFHAIHHSIVELDWLAAARVHPLDQIVTKGMSVWLCYVLGYTGVSIGISAGIYAWHSILLHANVRMNFGPLRWLIASPQFHHWHHANQPDARNKNYAGQLSILDKLFGTLYMPEGQTPTIYGVEEPVPDTYMAHLLYPFKRR